MQTTDPNNTTIELSESVFTPAETMLDLLGGHTRIGAPIRNEFIQARGTKRLPGEPGVLRHFVTDRQHLALKLYLLEHQLALAPPYYVDPLPAEVFARALGKTNAGAEASISRAHSWLAKRELIAKKRTGRALSVTLLQEDGSGTDRTRPTGHFFTLPRSFFLEEWHDKLSMHATVALLIALKQSYMTEWFPMPAERAAIWFGISADTIRRGFAELRDDHHLVESRLHEEANVRARGGKVRINQYRTIGPFERTRRPSPAPKLTPKPKPKPKRKRPARKAGAR